MFHCRGFCHRLLTTHDTRALLPIREILRRFPFKGLHNPLLTGGVNVRVGPREVSTTIRIFMVIIGLHG